MKPRHGDYGFDAPYVPLGYAATGLVGVALSIACFTYGIDALAWPVLVIGLLLLLSSLCFVWTTRRGKFAVWGELLDELSLRGDERVLDVGCGRGMVLLMAAEHLTTGKALGVDIWSSHDQSGNTETTALANAEREGVRDRIEVQTVDMRKLPFAAESFDLVTASLAIHNIADADGRAQALAEIWRVLKPGSVAMIVDFIYLDIYRRFFESQTGAVVERRKLGWRYWYAGPHACANLLMIRRIPTETL